MHHRSLLAALFLVPAACGGDDDGDEGGDDPVVDAQTGDLVERIAALPNVASVEELGESPPGHRYFLIGFDQPVDHTNPGGQHFIQYLTLTHRDEAAPLVLGSTGYWNYYGDAQMEPSTLLSANQLIVEHRYFSPSRPEPTDWAFLRVEQATADHHAIAESFHRIYTGAWVSTGGSKGGMTSIYHRYLYPDDVDGTVAYVAPHSLAAGDARYDGWFDEVLPADCLQRVRDAQIDLLRNRRQAMIDEAVLQDQNSTGIAYTRVSIPAAVESAVIGVEWAFFQYVGVEGCDEIPDESASDAAAWQWLLFVNGPDSLSDENLAAFEPYYYQAYAELGYPTTVDPHLEGLLQFGEDDYDGTDPPELPTYDPSVVAAAAEWVREGADDILFLYGEYDPWTAGMFDIGSNPGMTRYVVPAGTHSSRLVDLPADEQDAAFAILESWTGVAPAPASLRAISWMARPIELRLPVHALSMRARRAGR